MGMRFTVGAKSFERGFRAFFYLCAFSLLPLYSVPEAVAPSEAHRDSHAAGMDAPPPPLLESYTRLLSFGSPERRLLGALPVTGQLRAVKRTWYAVPPVFVVPIAAPADLAMFQQWRLEGG